MAGAGNGRTWAAVARTIMAMAPELVQMFDDQGTVLRIVRPESAVVEVPTVAGASGYSSPLHTDPETARLVHFANLLSDAWRFSTGLAFQKIVDVVQLQTERSQALEARLERAEANYRREMKERIEDVFDEAEAMREAAQRGDAAGARSIFESFLEGMMGGAAEAKHANGNSNGAAKS
ncbi:MAG TPA: hypothetical protein VF405_00835 [Gammaproteobacteria bacterium]